MRAMNIGRLGVAMAAVAALAAIALRAPAEPAAAPPPAARTIIPKPADIAASWKFPWDEIPGMTEANWRGQFHHDPRSDIRETCSLLQQMSDDDFSKLSAKMALPGGLGAALAPPTEGGTSQPATRPSRQAVVGALRELIDGTLDYAENDYSRSAPRPGAKPDAPADTDDDQLNIKIVIYSTPAIAGNFDLNADALTRVVNGMYEVERAGQENTKDSLQDLARQYNTEAEVGADVESRRGTLIAILNVTTDQTQLEGQTLDIGDNAYLWWTAKRNCTRRRIAITAQVRRGRAVATVSRTAVGPWADAAVEETRALLADLAGRLGPYGNAGAHAEGPRPPRGRASESQLAVIHARWDRRSVFPSAPFAVPSPRGGSEVWSRQTVLPKPNEPPPRSSSMPR